MNIVELRSTNVKRIKVVELALDPKKNLIVVSGKNGQGKTSLLDSIFYALGGKAGIPDKPIREGEEEAEVEVVLAGTNKAGAPVQYTVKRRFTEKDSYLTVTSQEGKFGNPQEFLDFIVGNLSFDPLLFTRMEGKKQIQTLIKAVGIDFTEIDMSIKALENERLAVGREVKVLATHSDEEIANAQKTLAAHPEGSKGCADEVTRIMDEVSRVSAQHAEFGRAKIQIEKIQEQITEHERAIDRLKKEMIGFQNIQQPKEDVAELKKAQVNAQALGRTIEEAERILKESERSTAKKAEWESLNTKVVEAQKQKSDTLAAAKMPIDGLAWTEESVTYNGIPFPQLSGAEQLKVSMAIAIQTNPKLKVILIRDGSLLDQDNLTVLEEMAKANEMQVWLEKVDESGKVGVVIEAGEVKAINE
jgi:DNA repair exonuclease SbcCD ATPase subunit